jgi:uncharacterized protein (DUF736 family)
MSINEKKDNSGAAFARESDNPKAPKYSGPATIGGKDYEVSIWQQTSQKGVKYLSLKFGAPYVPKNKKQEVNEDPEW